MTFLFFEVTWRLLGPYWAIFWVRVGSEKCILITLITFEDFWFFDFLIFFVFGVILSFFGLYRSVFGVEMGSEKFLRLYSYREITFLL